MLLLASASKARQRLLNLAGIPYEVMVSGLDESQINHSDPKQLVQLIAIAKANIVASKILDIDQHFFPNPTEINMILGCDSLFEFDGEVFGKPQNSKEAEIRWSKMSSGSGFLHTGHALLKRNIEFSKNKNVSFSHLFKEVVSTKLTFSSLSLSEIKSYVATGEPLNCAGGFALEGQGSKFVKRIEGCYSNVIGLSLPWLHGVL